MSTTFQVRWIIGTALGLAVGLPAGVALGAPLEVVVGMMLVTPVMLGLVGAILGASQWVALRGRIERAWLWIVGSAAGFGIGMTAGVVLVENVGRMVTGAPVRLSTSGTLGLAISLVVLGVLGGIAAGGAQWFYLRRYCRPSPAWILTSAAALPAAWLLGLGVATLASGGILNPVGLLLFLVVAGLMFGILTSRALPQLGLGWE